MHNCLHRFIAFLGTQSGFDFLFGLLILSAPVCYLVSIKRNPPDEYDRA